MSNDAPIAQLTTDSLEQYFASGVATTHVLSDSPRCELEIDPGLSRYELRTPADGPTPDVTGMQRVSVETVDEAEGPWFVLRIDARDIRFEAYGLIVSIVQAVRGGAGFAAATAAALVHLRAILASRSRLSTEQQVGLLGELLVVRRLLSVRDEEETIDWWLGPDAEQHDLALPDMDVEVKTTTSEARVHVIHGVGQLEPNPGRALWLLSIQVTRAGGARGVSLAGLVAEVSATLTNRRPRFVEHLAGLGWREDDADLYRDRYLLRSTPQAYLVDDDFPALTGARLADVVPHPELVSAVSYRVDVTSRTPADPGHPLRAFLDDPGVNQ